MAADESHLPTGNEAKESERQVRELEEQPATMEQAEAERKAHEKLQAENATSDRNNAKRQEVKQGAQSATRRPIPHHDTWHLEANRQFYIDVFLKAGWSISRMAAIYPWRACPCPPTAKDAG